MYVLRSEQPFVPTHTDLTHSEMVYAIHYEENREVVGTKVEVYPFSERGNEVHSWLNGGSLQQKPRPEGLSEGTLVVFQTWNNRDFIGIVGPDDKTRIKICIEVSQNWLRRVLNEAPKELRERMEAFAFETSHWQPRSRWWRFCQAVRSIISRRTK